MSSIDAHAVGITHVSTKCCWAVKIDNAVNTIKGASKVSVGTSTSIALSLAEFETCIRDNGTRWEVG